MLIIIIYAIGGCYRYKKLRDVGKANPIFTNHFKIKLLNYSLIVLLDAILFILKVVQCIEPEKSILWKHHEKGVLEPYRERWPLIASILMVEMANTVTMILAQILLVFEY